MQVLHFNYKKYTINKMIEPPTKEIVIFPF